MKKKIGLLAAVIAALPTLSPLAYSATVTWDGSTNMNWTQPDATSWTGATYLSGDAAQFLGAGTGTVTIDAGGVTPGSVLVNSTANYTFAGGAISGTSTLTTSGSGSVLTLTNANTYTGRTTVDNFAILDVGTISNNAISNSSGLLLSNSGILQGNGTFTRTLSGNNTPGAGQFAGAAGGFAARGGQLTVNFGGAGAQISLSGGAFAFGTNFIFGSSTADSKVVVVNDVNLNTTGSRIITVNPGIGGDAATAAEFSGVISNSATSSASITKQGTGMLILSNANNSFDGEVRIDNGTISFATINNIADGNSALGNPTTVAKGTIHLGQPGGTAGDGRLLYTGTGSTSDRVINLAGTTDGGIIEQGGTGLLKFTSNLTATGTGSKTLTLQGSTAGTGEIAGAIVDNSATNKTSLTKAGTGVWTLSGSNTYTGVTTVSAGTLLINGNQSSSTGAVTVASNATLGGSGIIGGAVTVNGTLAAGNSPGNLTVNGNVTIANGGKLSGEINGPTFGTQYDRVTMTGAASTFSLTGTNNLELSLGYAPAFGTNFFLVDNQGNNAISGVFEQLNGVTTTLTQGSSFTVSGQEFLISYTGNVTGNTFTGGNDLVIQAVPEPASVVLLTGGLIALSIFRRRRTME